MFYFLRSRARFTIPYMCPTKSIFLKDICFVQGDNLWEYQKSKDIKIFKDFSQGVLTSRDQWCVNFDKVKLIQNVDKLVKNYNNLINDKKNIKNTRRSTQAE